MVLTSRTYPKLSMLRPLLVMALFSFFYQCSSAEKIDRRADFSYGNYLSKKSRNEAIEPIALTLENGETLHGTISPDRKYLYFSNNASGNHDILFRPLYDIITIPLLTDSTNQTEPVVSPGGDMIAFIDDQLDPDGDVALLKVDPEDTIALYYESGQKAVEEYFTGKKTYLTNSIKKRARSKEINPVWSPDGKWIAYSSNRTETTSRYGPEFNAPQNIWLLPVNDPDKARQITTRGGIAPAFSPDGRRLVYVSTARGDMNGDLFEIDLQTNEERRLTSGKEYDLSPSYESPERIIFTRIASDTNGDGQVNQLDNGQIMALELIPRLAEKVSGDTEIETRLTFEEQVQPLLRPLNHNDLNLFNTRYTDFLGGGVLFARVSGENTHLYFLPRTGIIPNQNNPYLQYKNALKHRDPDSRSLAYNAVIYSEGKSDLASMYSAKALAGLLETAQTGPAKKSIAQNEIEQAEKALQRGAEDGDLYARISLELYYLSSQDRTPENYVFLTKTTPKSKTEYLAALAQRPIESIDLLLGSQPATLLSDQKLRNIVAYIYDAYAGALSQEGKEASAREYYYRLFFEYPEYHRNIDILHQLGEKSSDVTAAPELLFFIEPGRTLPLPEATQKALTANTQNETNEPSGNEAQEGILAQDAAIADKNVTNAEKTKEIEEILKLQAGAIQTLSGSISEADRIQAENFLYEFILRSLRQGRSYAVDEMSRGAGENEKRLRLILAMAKAKFVVEQGSLADAESVILQELPAKVPPQGLWRYRYLLLQGDLLARKGSRGNAYKAYYEAILSYRESYRDPEFEILCRRAIEYYQYRASLEETRKNDSGVLEHYEKLIRTIMALYTAGSTGEDGAAGAAKSKALSRLALTTFVNMNNYALRSHAAFPLAKDNIVTSLAGLYDQYIREARKQLITPFIFGRAHLAAIEGIQLHTYFENNRLLTKKNKESVLVRFKEAEIDFQWSIYSDSSFADSYVMLGWMYQFIDDKREVYLSKGSGKAKVKDFDEFKSLYDIYFPEYLFEKNIALFRKSLAFIAPGTSSHVLNSFYLNIGNNYYLLNNHAKAVEFYEKILNEKKGSFAFENELQEAQYYFHFGKSSFYTGKHAQADQLLQKALAMYAPMNNAQLRQKNPKSPKGQSAKDNGKLLEKINLDRANNRAILYKYLALNASEARQYQKAIQYYGKLKTLLTEYGIDARRSIIELEIARQIYLESKVWHDAQRLRQALGNIRRAKKYLESEDEITAPRYHARVKILKLIPFTWPMSPAQIVYGDSAFIFPLPTVNTWEYLYSLESDTYRSLGQYSKAIQSINRLIEYAEKDKTPHGEKTLITAYMRKGELLYARNKIDQSIEAYETVLKMSDDVPVSLSSIVKAKKNQLYLTMLQLENANMAPPELLKRLDREIQNLEEFSNDYIERKVRVANDRVKEENKDVNLTSAEVARIQKEALSDIYKIRLYSGILKTYRAGALNQMAAQSKSSLDDFINAKQNAYLAYGQALPYLSGDVPAKNETVNLLDTYADRRLALILTLNRSYLYQEFGFFQEASEESEKAAIRAEEFQAIRYIPIANIRLSHAQKRMGKKYTQPLETADRAFRNNPSLSNEYPSQYDLITRFMIEKRLEQGRYLEALEYANRARHREALKAIHAAALTSDPEFRASIQTYQDIEAVKKELKGDIEKARMKREPSGDLEKMLEDFDKQQTEIRNELLMRPDTAAFSALHFPELTGVKQIGQYRENYVYLFQNSGVTHLVSARNGHFSYRKFNLTSAQLQNYLEYRQKKQEEKTGPDAETSKQNEQNGQHLPLSPAQIKEAEQMIAWMRAQNAEILFPDRAYWGFPFSQILGQNLPREYTFQAARMFRNNTVYADDRWALLHSEAPPEDPNRSYHAYKSMQEIASDAYRINALDLELSSSSLHADPENTNSVAHLFLSPLKTSGVIVSGLANNSANAPLEGGLNMAFAAQGAASVFYTGTPRSEASQQVAAIIGVQPFQAENPPAGPASKDVQSKTTPGWYTGNPKRIAHLRSGKPAAITEQELRQATLKRCQSTLAARSLEKRSAQSRQVRQTSAGVISPLLQCNDDLSFYAKKFPDKALPPEIQSIQNTLDRQLIAAYIESGQIEQALSVSDKRSAASGLENAPLSGVDLEVAAFMVNEMIYRGYEEKAFEWIRNHEETSFTPAQKNAFLESYALQQITKGNRSFISAPPEERFAGWQAEYFNNASFAANGIANFRRQFMPSSDEKERWALTMSGALAAQESLEIRKLYPEMQTGGPWADLFHRLVARQTLPAWAGKINRPAEIEVGDFEQNGQDANGAPDEALLKRILEIEYRVYHPRPEFQTAQDGGSEDSSAVSPQVMERTQEFIRLAIEENQPFAVYTLVWTLIHIMEKSGYDTQTTLKIAGLASQSARFMQKEWLKETESANRLPLPYHQKAFLELIELAQPAMNNPALLSDYAQNIETKNLLWSEASVSAYNSLLYLAATFRTSSASNLAFQTWPESNANIEMEASWQRFQNNLAVLNEPQNETEGEPSFRPERASIVTFHDLALLFQYYTERKEYTRALSLYVYHDRKLNPGDMSLDLPVTGVVETFPGKRFVWMHTGAETVIRNMSEKERMQDFLASSKNKMIYLPARTAGARVYPAPYGAMTFRAPRYEFPFREEEPEQKPGQKEPRPAIIWRADPGSESSAAYSFLRMELGEPQTGGNGQTTPLFQVVSGQTTGNETAYIFIHTTMHSENGLASETAQGLDKLPPGYHLMLPAQATGTHLELLRLFIEIMHEEPETPVAVFEKAKQKLVEEMSSPVALDQAVLLVR